MQWILIQILQGLLIGAGGILPGISGASMAVVFGVYEDLTAVIAYPIRNFKSFVSRYWLLCLSIGAGFVVCTVLLDRLFSDYTDYLIFLFTGFIAGTLPGIYTKARKKGLGFSQILACTIAFAALIVPVFLHRVFHFLPETAPVIASHNFFLWFLSGAIIGIGSLLPGVSASFLLIWLGSYGPLLDAVYGINISILLPLGGGVLLALVLFSRFAQWLYRHHHGTISFGILGLTIASIIVVFPGFKSGLSIPLCLMLASAGFASSFVLEQFQEKIS